MFQGGFVYNAVSNYKLIEPQFCSVVEEEVEVTSSAMSFTAQTHRIANILHIVGINTKPKSSP